MNRFLKWEQAPTRAWRLLMAVLLLASFVPLSTLGRSERIHLFPKVRAGQTFSYEISYRSDKQLKTESSAIAATSPDSAKVDVHSLLHLEVLSIEPVGERALIHARASFEVLNSDLHFKISNREPAGDGQGQRHEPDTKFIEFTLLPTGAMDQVKGLTELLPEQQQAWQEWASRFMLAAAFPLNGLKIAQRWKSQEVETSPSPIAGLVWIRESTYVGDEPCRPVQITAQDDIRESDRPDDTCAVILTRAALKQESSVKNATPEDFKLHELRTSGTARGTNRIISYVSLKTGLLVRASEEADQQMDVTVKKADASNRVRYAVNAKSRSEIFLVAETPLNH